MERGGCHTPSLGKPLGVIYLGGTMRVTSVFFKNSSTVHDVSLGNSHKGTTLISFSTPSMRNVTRSWARVNNRSSSRNASYTLSRYVFRFSEVQFNIVRPGSMAASSFAICGAISGLKDAGIFSRTRSYSTKTNWKNIRVL